MGQFSMPERTWIVEHYFRALGKENRQPLKDVMSGFTNHFNKKSPTKRNIRKMVEKYREHGTLANLNSPNSGRRHTVRINENRGKVMDRIIRSPKKSIRRLAREMNVSFSSMRRLVQDIGAHSYKIQIFQQLTPDDYQKRMTFFSVHWPSFTMNQTF